jgi:hypothetical protein
MPCCQQGWAIFLGPGYQGVDWRTDKLALTAELECCATTLAHVQHGPPPFRLNVEDNIGVDVDREPRSN